MADVQITGEQFMELVFIEAVKKDYLRVMCNVGGCNVVWFEDKDYRLGTDWMAPAAKHIVGVHPDKLRLEEEE